MEEYSEKVEDEKDELTVRRHVSLRPRSFEAGLIIIIISLLKTHVRRTCLHSKNITMKHTRVILCYATDSYIG